MRKKQSRNKPVPVAKQVWEWTEEVSPEEIKNEHVHTAYRLRIGKCMACRKNCVGNPLCHRGIGESFWLKPIKHDDYLEDELNEFKEHVRKDNEFVGLKNLGATCYVNTFLQLWFHNHHFRKAVYSYTEVLKDGESFPQTPCGHLQLMFGMLECSKRKNIDPSSFIQCLGLDTDLQQDAQEFSKLLLNLLTQNSTVGEALCKEFRGEYEYCTKCKFCNTVSKRPSEFYELDLNIQGHNVIEDCLKEFLQIEILEKDDQYSCETCNCRRDASRQIVMKTLPRTLNLQLLRFVFDKATYTKKKLSRALSFPDVLDLSPFVSIDQPGSINSLQYDLTAVLIHRGPSAFSGHYIAHIKDASTGLWHKFNDENVDRLKSGKQLNLDAQVNDDFDINMPKPAKVPKIRKNCHSSKDAYMLVYTRRELHMPCYNEDMDNKIPDVVKEKVDKDNEDFFMTMDTMISNSKQENERRIARQSEVRSALKELFEKDISDLLQSCQWVPITWLKHALSGIDIEVKKVTMEKFSCPHNKLDPLKISGLKCISKQLMTVLSNGNLDAEPQHDMLCLECVKQRCRVLRSKSSLVNDHDEVTKLVKENEDVEDGFYIGRYSLRCWKSMVCKRLEGVDATKSQDHSQETSDDDDEIDFNEDLLCEHGRLTFNPKHYRIIPCEAWRILQKYFPNATEYRTGGELSTCSICMEDSHQAKQENELKKMIASQQKAVLTDLFLYRNRPCYDDLHCKISNNLDGPTCFVVNASFVQQWRGFIRNPAKHDIVSSVNNEALLCPHGKLSNDPISEFGVDPDFEKVDIVLLWPSEWDYISKNFVIDTVISISVDASETKQIHMNGDSTVGNSVIDSEHGNNMCEEEIPDEDGKCVTANITSAVKETFNLKLSPDICKECLLGKQLEKELHLRKYSNKVIYVKKVNSTDKEEWVKEYFAKESYSGRKRKRNTTRGEKPLTVSSEWTLKQLKIQIMQLHSIPPFDQNLWVDGRRLEDDEATLEMLALLPESTVVVIADEPDESVLDMLPVVPNKDSTTEAGFKGTSLIGR